MEISEKSRLNGLGNRSGRCRLRLIATPLNEWGLADTTENAEESIGKSRGFGLGSHALLRVLAVSSMSKITNVNALT